VSAIPQYSAVNAPFVDLNTGRLTFAGNIFLRDLWLRTGGTVAPTNNELSATEYADAGIESLQAEIYQLRDQLDALQSATAELVSKLASFQTDTLESYGTRELVASIVKRLDDIDQGVSL
jgi:hypothetical protein